MDTSLSRTNTNSGMRRPVHDKTSYGIIATPSSPTNTSPTLTQSTSNSNSSPSTSPRPLTTPPRSSRSRTRYPELGRVPLHRRGTSKTYERLEDLLREAGYKETRVFTPEGERAEARSAQKDAEPAGEEAGVKNSMGAFVGFLAGLMPNAAASRSTSSLPLNAEEEHVYSPPASPLLQRQIQKQKQRQDTSSSSEPYSSSPLSSLMTSSIESLEPTPRAPRRRPPSRSTTPVPAPSMYSHPQSSQQSLRRPTHLMVHRPSDQSDQSYSTSSRPSPLSNHPSQTSPYHHPGHLPSVGTSNQQIAQPRPSRAHAYLRHMASAPNMPKRPSSTTAQQQQPRHSTFVHKESDFNARRNENNEDTEPALPRTWLESVARAVLFGGMGAYIGGPSIVDPPSQASGVQKKTLRPTRSSISQTTLHSAKRPPPRRSGLSDQTNTKNAAGGEFLLAPPDLFARLERGRSGTSVSEVSRTRVVCRSAPASRSSSLVRGSREGGTEKRDRGRGGKEREQGRGRGRGRAVERDRLPSLANTRTEGDGWVRGKRAKEGGVSARDRYLGGWGMEAESSDGEEGGEERMSSSEEEDGELNLARMLVNPKRQNSIKSLRKHLAGSGEENANSKLTKMAGMRAGRGMMMAGSTQGSCSGSVRQRIPEDEDWDGSEAEEWGRGWVRNGGRRRTSEEEDDDETYAAKFLGDGRGERMGKGSGGGVFGSGRSGTGRSRLGIPGPWGLVGGGS
ncbi:hypothetical protein FPV67DRAFT_1492919 [Lyophyllum atratum]|nr:hypothetical protein FPV67DRAFT_1492919 [Lyophyllum atratum]